MRSTAPFTHLALPVFFSFRFGCRSWGAVPFAETRYSPTDGGATLLPDSVVICQCNGTSHIVEFPTHTSRPPLNFEHKTNLLQPFASPVPKWAQKWYLKLIQVTNGTCPGTFRGYVYHVRVDRRRSRVQVGLDVNSTHINVSSWPKTRFEASSRCRHGQKHYLEEYILS